jgi:hypothetical protein
LALAKLWEHRLKDPTRAEVHARATELAEGAREHLRRRARLTKKLERAAARAALPPPKKGRRRSKVDPEVGVRMAAVNLEVNEPPGIFG